MDESARTSVLESVSRLVLYALVFLLPLFALPFALNPLDLSKSLLLYFGVLLSGLLWLIVRLQKGEFTFPKSSIFLGLLALLIVYLVSSFFSSSIPLSLIGPGYNTDTFAFLFFGGAGLFLVSSLIDTESRAIKFYITFFVSALCVFIVQLLNVVFNVKLGIIPNGILTTSTANLIGGWNDFGIFFGLVGLTSLIFFEMYPGRKILKALSLIIIAVSLSVIYVVIFQSLFAIFGSVTLVFLVYLFSRSFFDLPSPEKPKHSPFRLSFFILLFSLFLLLAGNFITKSTLPLNISSLDVRPSLSTTWGIVQNVLQREPILGTGPNTFLYSWLTLKPLAVNNTIFWNARFNSGISHFLSTFATTGILGGLAISAFLFLFLLSGLKTIPYTGEEKSRSLLMASLFGSLYLWIFIVTYSPGALIFILAFIFTGLFISMLAQAERIKRARTLFLENPKVGFVSTLLAIILIIGSISTLYLVFGKYRAARLYADGLEILNTTRDLPSAKEKFVSALSLDKEDFYARAIAEVNLMELQELVTRQDLSPEDARREFQNALGAAIQNAQAAKKLNPSDPANYFELGRIYESVVPLRVSQADEFALNAYADALKNSPLDPTSQFFSARVKLQTGKMEEARSFLESALKIKADFAPALFMLSQIEVQQGNLKAAIEKTEQTAVLTPNDVGVIFQLGLLYYQDKNFDGAKSAFEKAVLLNTDYSNARYFLGLIYDRKGMKNEAILQFEHIKKFNPDNQEVERILSNLRDGEDALLQISPPAERPERRKSLPIKEIN